MFLWSYLAHIMKQNFHFTALLILILLVFSSRVSARFLVTKQGQEEVKVQEIASEVSTEQIEDSESMHHLMGMEACENGDEECFKRRLISEAHLDYIYTQHVKP